jgi:glycerophosphoryl diester phosphodiesterase
MKSLLLLTCASLAVLAVTPARAIDLQGHRGTRGYAPENTLPAFEKALEIGVTTLELDIGLTADGVAVISHDSALNPALTRDAGGQWLAGERGPLIRSLTFAQLQKYDVGRLNPQSAYAAQWTAQQPVDGTRLPALGQLFDRVKALGATEVRFNIETKTDPNRPKDTATPEEMTRALVKVIRDAGMTQRVTIQSFDWRNLRIARQLEPAIPTVCLTIQANGADNLRDGTWTGGQKLADVGSVPKMVKNAGCSAWSPNAGVITLANVKEAHALGLKVIPWTVNNAVDAGRLLADDVDGIISDYPDRVRAVMLARGLYVPAPLFRK